MTYIIRQQILLPVKPSFSFLFPILLYSSLFPSLSPPYVFVSVLSVVLSSRFAFFGLYLHSFSILEFLKFIYTYVCMCVTMWIFVYHVHARSNRDKKRLRSSGTKFAGYCDPPCGFWFLNSGLLQDQQVPSATESSFHLSPTFTLFSLPGQFSWAYHEPQWPDII